MLHNIMSSVFFEKKMAYAYLVRARAFLRVRVQMLRMWQFVYFFLYQ